LGGPLPHIDHPRRSSCPLWSEDLGEDLTREEIEEIVRLTELLRELPRRCVLADVHREFSATGYVVGYDIAESDLTELAPVVGLGNTPRLSFATPALVC
jgi:hypothetical protein